VSLVLEFAVGASVDESIILSLFVLPIDGPLHPTLSSPTSASVGDGEQWCLAAADLSRRLHAVTQMRDNTMEKTAWRQQRWAEPVGPSLGEYGGIHE
jgi:hypothetical protein